MNDQTATCGAIGRLPGPLPANSGRCYRHYTHDGPHRDRDGHEWEPENTVVTARAVLTTVIDAPNASDAARWAASIRDLIHAEFGDSMRLHTAITLEPPSVPEPGCGEECAEGHVHAGRCTAPRVCEHTLAPDGTCPTCGTAGPGEYREQLAAAIVKGGGCVDLAAATDAVLAVVGPHITELAADVARYEEAVDQLNEINTRLAREAAATGRAEDDAEHNARLFHDARIRAETAETTIGRVRALRQTWLAQGAPRLGTSIARWWDKRLTELDAALDQPTTPTAEPHTGLVVEPYRADDGTQKWVFRCWGTDTCDGELHLDLSSREAAERARNRHAAEHHQEAARA